MINILEYALYLACFSIYINSSESRIGTGAGHETDSTGNRDDKSGPAVCKNFPDLQLPSSRYTLKGRGIRQRQMGLNHTEA